MRYLFYSTLLLGIIMLCWPSLRLLRHSVWLLRTRRPATSDRQARSLSQLDQHIRRLLAAVGGRSDSASFLFYVISGGLFAVTLLVFGWRTTWPFALLISAALGAAPYLWLRTRLQRIRIDSSYEGDVVINEFAAQYKINYRNVVEALGRTAANLPDAPLCGHGMARLCRHLRDARSDREINEALDEFTYRIDTAWAGKLSYNIGAACRDDIIIDDSLADLVDEIGKARKVIEQGRRVNNEAVVVIKYMTIPMYLITMIWGSKYMGVSAKAALINQFTTPTGIKYFAVIVTLYAVSVMMMMMFSRQKMDLD